MGSYNTVLAAKYGYRFLPIQRPLKKSKKEKDGIKRMKRYVKNRGNLNASRIIYCHTLDEGKINILLHNLYTKMKNEK